MDPVLASLLATLLPAAMRNLETLHLMIADAVNGKQMTAEDLIPAQNDTTTIMNELNAMKDAILAKQKGV